MAEQDKSPQMPQGAGTPFAAGNFTLSPASASMRFAAGEVVFRAIREVSELLLQAVIVPGNKVSEGRLIEAVTTIWFDIIDLLRKDPSVAFQIPWYTWEEIIAGSYDRAGFDVILTPRSGDRGKDVIATMKGHGTIRIIDQVKAYKPGHLVKATDLRAMLWVLHTDGATSGVVTTTSDFAPRIWTDPTIAPYVPSRLELTNGAALIPRLQKLAWK